MKNPRERTGRPLLAGLKLIRARAGDARVFAFDFVTASTK
jgi:hypothetical protein